MDMDIEQWLHGLELQQYAATFRANGIDAEVLPDLTEADLEKLGIVLGHRKRLMKAIAASRKPEAVQAVLPSLLTGAGAERRQLTVMFCDLVGSTALASRLDPEDLRDVIGAYHRCVAKTVTRFGGYVAKYMETAFSFISVTRKRMRTTPSARSAPGWSWSRRLQN